jgi:hypothetical protein
MKIWTKQVKSHNPQLVFWMIYLLYHDHLLWDSQHLQPITINFHFISNLLGSTRYHHVLSSLAKLFGNPRIIKWKVRFPKMG